MSRAMISHSSEPAILGLGCSRLGSILTGGDRKAAEALVRGAIDLGIRHFDTANIYGQGDSERALAQALKGAPSNIVLASKIGQRQPFLKRALLPLKRPLAQLVMISGAARRGLTAERAKPLPTEFQPKAVRRAVEGSLRRLEREYVDIFYLHGPSVSEISNGEAIGALEDLRGEGKLGRIGVSCDRPEEVLAALADDRVSIIQLPLGLGRREFEDVAAVATSKGVTVVAREILGGAGQVSTARPGAVAEAIAFAVGHPSVKVALLGTTKLENLAAAQAAAQALSVAS